MTIVTDYHLRNIDSTLSEYVETLKLINDPTRLNQLYGILSKYEKLLESSVESYKKIEKDIEENYEPVLDHELFVSLGYSRFDPTAKYFYNPITDEMVMRSEAEFGLYSFKKVEKDSEDKRYIPDHPTTSSRDYYLPLINEDTEPWTMDFSRFHYEKDDGYCRYFKDPQTGEEIKEDYTDDYDMEFTYEYRVNSGSEWMSMNQWNSERYSLLDEESIVALQYLNR